MITPAYAPTATERVLPRMALDFTTASLDSRVTVTRALNTATAVNSSGYVATVNADLPRFDYDPTTLLCKGLLIEETRANLALNSANLSAASWVLLRAVNTQNSGAAPDDTNSANLLVDTAVAGTHVAIQLFTKAASAIAYSASVYLKAGVRTRGEFRMSDQAGNGTRVTFSLATGAVGTPTVFGTGFTLGTASIVTMPNGWYRVILTTTSNSSTTLGLELYIANDALSISYVGNGSGFYVWGAQLEVGAFATSYIPTTTTSLTRNADVVSMTGTNFSSWWTATTGAVVTRTLQNTVSGTRPSVQFDDTTANNFIVLRGNTTNPELYIKATTDQAQIDAGTIAANSAYSLGGVWNTNNCAAAINGAAPVLDTSVTVPTVTQARLGSDGTNYLNGYLQSLRYWPQRITDAEIQAFSK